MYRLFVALDLPAEIKQTLLGLSYGIPGARWLQPEQLHITLRFIGEVDGGLMRDIQSALQTIEAPELTVSLHSVGYFPPRKNPQTVWAGVERNDAIVHLRNKIESALVRCGLPPESRKFSPHVVIARLKEVKTNKLADFLALNGLFRTEPFSVDRFILYSSYLGSEGASYEIEEEYLLNSKQGHAHEALS